MLLIDANMQQCIDTIYNILCEGNLNWDVTDDLDVFNLRLDLR